MAKELKTGWKRIGRSGATVDGRSIEPLALEQVAKNYNKGLFTALIWPDHLRWFNMGTVEELRATPNEEDGVDLFAIIAPNDIYLSTNNAGQGLFTSMELMPNFRDSGEYYLTGLAATDNPASAATSEMRFTGGADKTAILSDFTEHTPQLFNEDQAPGWFQRFAEKFTHSDEDIMDKKTMDALEAKFTALELKLTALKPAEKPAEDKPTDAFAALTAKVESLTALVAELKAEKPAATDDKYTALAAELATLTEAFKAAVGETNGTNAGEHKNSDTDSSAYL